MGDRKQQHCARVLWVCPAGPADRAGVTVGDRVRKKLFSGWLLILNAVYLRSWYGTAFLWRLFQWNESHPWSRNVISTGWPSLPKLAEGNSTEVALCTNLYLVLFVLFSQTEDSSTGEQACQSSIVMVTNPKRFNVVSDQGASDSSSRRRLPTLPTHSRGSSPRPSISISPQQAAAAVGASVSPISVAASASATSGSAASAVSSRRSKECGYIQLGFRYEEPNLMVTLWAAEGLKMVESNNDVSLPFPYAIARLRMYGWVPHTVHMSYLSNAHVWSVFLYFTS